MPPIEETNETILNWMPFLMVLENNEEPPVAEPTIVFCPCPHCMDLREGITNDNTTKELVELARQGNEEQFRELASCLMPIEEVQECWDGARQRLNLNKT